MELCDAEFETSEGNARLEQRCAGLEEELRCARREVEDAITVGEMDRACLMEELAVVSKGTLSQNSTPPPLDFSLSTDSLALSSVDGERGEESDAIMPEYFIDTRQSTTMGEEALADIMERSRSPPSSPVAGYGATPLDRNTPAKPRDIGYSGSIQGLALGQPLLDQTFEALPLEEAREEVNYDKGVSWEVSWGSPELGPARKPRPSSAGKNTRGGGVMQARQPVAVD